MPEGKLSIWEQQQAKYYAATANTHKFRWWLRDALPHKAESIHVNASGFLVEVDAVAERAQQGLALPRVLQILDGAHAIRALLHLCIAAPWLNRDQVGFQSAWS